jgi:hypothetical protein
VVGPFKYFTALHVAKKMELAFLKPFLAHAFLFIINKLFICSDILADAISTAFCFDPPGVLQVWGLK